MHVCVYNYKVFVFVVIMYRECMVFKIKYVHVLLAICMTVLLIMTYHLYRVCVCTLAGVIVLF